MDEHYTILPFPRSRQVVVDAGRLGAGRPLIFGLLEFDVTQARTYIREHKAATGETLSFTAFVVTCLAQAIALDPSVQAYRDWRNRLIIFYDIDIVTMIEAEHNGVAIPHIIRSANRKSFRQIHDEIRMVQSSPARSPQRGRLAKLGEWAPWFLRRPFYWAIRKNPIWFKRNAGTVILTSVGMFGQGAGWGLGFLPMHTLGITIGGMAERPALENGQLVTRDYLSITITTDHDIVDGAPTARFAQRFKDLVEQGYGLPEGESSYDRKKTCL